MTDSPCTDALVDTAHRPFNLLSGLLRRISGEWRGEGLVIRLPSGRSFGVGQTAPTHASLRIRDFNFVRRVLYAGDIGFAEGYVAGEWDTPDLARLLTALAENFDALKRLGVGGPLARLANKLADLGKLNTLQGARRNIEAHYDLGNAFYSSWLDPGMTYSSALFAAGADSLETAQREKYAALARAIGLEPGHRVLEIGCGWGAFAEFAAREIGARVVGLTLSPAQLAFAQERIHRLGLSDRVDLRLCDYREADGVYDRLVSIEMFEAVGERYWPSFFEVVGERLSPCGVAGLQVITIRDQLFERYRRRVDFIQKHVFPGGMLPSEPRLSATISKAGMTQGSTIRFGADYGRTLAAWSASFEAAWPGVRALGYDERFRRLWRFYLAYCEAGFRSGRTDVIQTVVTR